jgi:hypothetical protein
MCCVDSRSGREHGASMMPLGWGRGGSSIGAKGTMFICWLEEELS